MYGLILLLSSCGSTKTANREKITVSPYQTIVCSSGGIEIYFSQGKAYTADLDKGDNINISVKDGNLLLSRKGKQNGNVKVYLSADKINGIVLSGGSRFFSDELKNGKNLSIAASGTSGIDIKKADMENCNVALSGKANCMIRQSKSDKITIATSGTSSADINIEKSKNANVAASGKSAVTVSGKVGNISVDASENADINIVNLKYDNINTNKGEKSNIRK
jgi:hypothetical protein